MWHSKPGDELANIGFLLLGGCKQLVAQIVSVYEGMAAKTNKSRDDLSAGLKNAGTNHRSSLLVQYFESISTHWSFLTHNAVLSF